MNKYLIIINGKGGVGKDTLCNFAAEKFKVRNVSSITPIKKIASENGWNGEKTPKARTFLALLKDAFIMYNDLPTAYLLEQYKEFLKSDEEIMFAHIREGKEIDKFKSQISGKCFTLLVKRNVTNWGNDSDDKAECYPYDFIYYNSFCLGDAKKDFIQFLTNAIKHEEENS